MTLYRITPVPKPRMTQRDKWQKRPSVLRYRAFKDQVRLRRVVLDPPCRVVFWMPMPASWPEAKKAKLDGTPHLQRPDNDNLQKALLDAVHLDDSHVWSIHAEKRWARKAGIEIELTGDPCRVCGCTDEDCSQCVEKTGAPCAWVEPGLCSACV